MLFLIVCVAEVLTSSIMFYAPVRQDALLKVKPHRKTGKAGQQQIVWCIYGGVVCAFGTLHAVNAKSSECSP